nr:reverse transcriptase domain-containing protein [Tanacetum cinerariifolium]
MQTRSSSRLVSNPSSNSTPSTNPNLKGCNRRRSKQRIEEFNLEELSPPIVTMADQRTMAQLLQAPTEGYEDAIFQQSPFKDLLRACPHHGFSELHQLDTFYNALNSKDQDSLNSAAGGNFLDKMPRECLAIIERKSKVRYLHNKPIVAKVSMNTSTFGISPDVPELMDIVKALLLDKKSQNQAPATVKGEKLFNYNQGNTSYRPPMITNQIRPPGFPPVLNNQNVQLNQRNNQNHYNQNPNRGNNFNHRPVYQPPVFQPPAYQAPAYQAPAPQTKGVSKKDFSAYIKANDAVMRNMKTQGQNMQNQLTNLTELLTKFVNSNSASTSSSGTLPSNTIANPRRDKDTVTPPNNRSTEDVQPPVVPTESPILNSEPVNSPIIEHVIAPVSAPKPNPNSSIPYPSRRNDERNHEKANNQIEKFYQVFKDMNDSPQEIAKKLEDPGKFLIPCDFPRMDECLALADLGANINLMPLSMWKRISLPELTPTCMTLELVDRSISRPIGIAEDVYVKVGKFHFPADFVVIDYDADPRVPLILKRSFLKTGRALIDVFEGELPLRVGEEAITFNLDQTSRYSANYNDNSINRIDVIEMACEEYSQEVLGFSDVIASGNPTPYYDSIVSTTSPTLTLFGNSDFLLEEVDSFLTLEDDPTLPEVDQTYVDSEGDILLLEAFLNDDPSLPPPNQGNYLPEVHKELKICEAKSDKSLIDEPPEVELKDLPTHIEYAFLEGDDKLPVIIACFSHLEKMLKRYEDTNLCLNWEKSHFMVKEGIVLGHKISKEGIEVDKAKVDVITKLPHRTTVKARPMTRLLEKDTPFHFSKECVEAFQTLKRKLTEAPILIAPDWDMPFELMCDASDFAIGAVLRQRQDKHFRPIHYASKTMNEAESNYTITEKEMLAVLKPLRFSRLATMDPPGDTMSQTTQPRRCGTLRAIISDRGMHFCNDQFAKVMQKFGVTHRLATPYHPQTSGHVEVSNHGLKHILERTVEENRASWSDKLDDALWAFRTTYKTPIGCDHKKVQLNELNELHDQAYENSLIYKEKIKRLHDSKIKDSVFNIGDRVLLFNSRLKIFSGKLKSCWSGPFTISHIYPYGTVELSQPDGPNFKVNGHRLKHYFGEDVPKMVGPDLQTFLKDN